MPVAVSTQCSVSGGARTLMTQVHLQLQGLELVRQPRTGLGTHLLVGPLLQAIELLVDVHPCGGAAGDVEGRGARGDIEASRAKVRLSIRYELMRVRKRKERRGNRCPAHAQQGSGTAGLICAW
jgi:hypothetical protein